MIYTIGIKELYDSFFDAMKNDVQYAVKLGKTDSYDGGSVFKTYEDAADYKEEYNLFDYDIYGVIANWEDTEPNDHGLFHNLLADARLVRI